MNPTIVIKAITWTAPSDTRVGTRYTVSAPSPDAELRCDCPARTTCKHIARALAGELGRPRVRVTQRPVIRRTHAQASPEMRDLAASLDL